MKKPGQLEPIAYEQSIIKDWFDDVVHNLPDGFVKDFIEAGRGLTSTTMFCAWTALFCVSSVVKRHAYIKWEDGTGKMFGNLYVFIVGPPLITGKSCIADRAERILADYHKYLRSDDGTVGRKRVNLFRGSVTAKGLFDGLKPKKFTEKFFEIETVDGQEQPVEKEKICYTGAEAAMVVSELGTFFTKQKYGEDLPIKMMDLYTCKMRDDDMTRTGGYKSVENVYVTMLGCVTKEDLHSSLPPSVFGNGFLSRVNIAYEPRATRKFTSSFPQETIVGSEEELKKRLAFVADSSWLDYNFTKQAVSLYDEIFKQARNEIEVGLDKGNRIIHFRLAQHVLKVAFLLAVQSYDKKRDITADHVLQAVKIVRATTRSSQEALSDIGATPYAKHITIIVEKFRKKREITRRELMQRLCYTRVPTKITNECLEQLRQEGVLKVYDKDDGERNKITSDIREKYVYGGYG